jgi:hypothetical protein
MLQRQLGPNILQNVPAILYANLVWGSSNQANRTVVLGVSPFGTEIVKNRLQCVDTLEPRNLFIDKSLSLANLEDILAFKPMEHGAINFAWRDVVTLLIAERGHRDHNQVRSFLAQKIDCMHHTVSITFLNSLEHNSSVLVSHHKLIFAAVVREVVNLQISKKVFSKPALNFGLLHLC